MGLHTDSILVAGIATLAVALIAIVGLVSSRRTSKQVSSLDEADEHLAREHARGPNELEALPELEAEPSGPVESETPPELEAEPPGPVEPEAPPELEAEPSGPVESETPPELEAEPPGPVEPEAPPELEAEPPGPVEPEAPPELEAEPPGPVESETPPELDAEPPGPVEPGAPPELDAEPSGPVEPGAPPELDAEPSGPVESETPPELEVEPPEAYVPSIRTPKTTRPKSRQEPKKTVEQRSRPINLQVSVRVVFGRRNSVQVSLLPARGGNLREEIEVMGPSGEESWFACQDEWYGDLFPADISDSLANGTRWRCGSATWTLSPRDIFVLAPNQTIYGFVSTTRLLLNEDHLILCKEGAKEIVCGELEKAGCDDFDCRSGHGIPEGWALFSNVRPIVAVDHDESAGIRNVLRPLEDIDIYLEGGIRLSRKRWLHGHPPRIRIRGGRDENPAVSIDSRAASRNSDGSFETQSAFSLGQHVVFSGGVTVRYEIVEGQESWNPFEAFRYNMDFDHNREVTVCGPIVMGDGEQNLVPTTNRCLLGAKPGQIYFCESPYGQSTKAMLAITKFPVVWALPINPYQCKKSDVFAIAISTIEVSPLEGYLRRRLRMTDEVFHWCNAILNSSRKGLRPDPNDRIIMKLWSEYVHAARQIRRSMK